MAIGPLALLPDNIGLMRFALSPDQEQPETRYFAFDGIAVVQHAFRHAGSVVPQHSHSWDHLSTIVHGGVRVWADGEFQGECHAPDSIVIKAGIKHTFQTLEDNTILHCTHNISRTGVVEIESEHQLREIG